MNSSLITKINLTIGIVMVLVYFFAGTFILFFNFVLLDGVDVTFTRTIGALIIVYGMYRLYRTIQIFKSRKNEDETEE